jgi:hypothetical protein
VVDRPTAHLAASRPTAHLAASRPTAHLAASRPTAHLAASRPTADDGDVPMPRARYLVSAGVLAALLLAGGLVLATRPSRSGTATNGVFGVPAVLVDARGCPVQVRCHAGAAPAPLRSALARAFPSATTPFDSATLGPTGRVYRAVLFGQDGAASILVSSQCIPGGATVTAHEAQADDVHTDLTGDTVTDAHRLVLVSAGTAGCSAQVRLNVPGTSKALDPAARALAADPAIQLQAPPRPTAVLRPATTGRLDATGCPVDATCTSQPRPSADLFLATAAAFPAGVPLATGSLYLTSNGRTLRTDLLLRAGRSLLLIEAQCIPAGVVLPTQSDRIPAQGPANATVTLAGSAGCSAAITVNTPAGSPVPAEAVKQLAQQNFQLS